MKYFIYILIVVLLILGCADKPTGTSVLGSIYGVVYDQDNNSELAGVTVSINSVGNRTTNSNGFYEFKDLGEETYTVFASKSGYATASEQIKVEPNRNKELNFNLHTIQQAQFLGTPIAFNFGNYYTNLEFTVNNGGDEELEWQVNSNQPWLTASPSTGITTTEADKVTVTINRSDLEVGNYSGNLSFTSNGGNQVVPVTMEVSPVVLYVSPSTLNFGSIETSKSFTISNPGFGELNWSLSSNQSWINMTPTSGTNTTNSSNIIVTIDRTGLNPNFYNGSISITSNGGNQDIAISMQVEEDTSIVEHFNNLDNWVNTTYSTSFPEPWVIDGNGYSGSCAKSECAGSGGGDKLSQTFSFPTSVTASIWVKKSHMSYITVYLKVDGVTLLNWGGGTTEGNQWIQLQCNIPAGEHEIVIETNYAGTVWIDELEIIGN